MKYIFTVHSPLTFLVAYSTIQYLSIDTRDVIFISLKYKVPIVSLKVFPSYPERYHSLFEKIKYFNVPKSYDKYINEITGNQKFIAFIDMMSYYQKILVTHVNCENFHFIEEGNGTYQVKDDLQDLAWAERNSSFRVKHFFDSEFIRTLVRVFRGYNLKLLSLPYNYMAYSNFECVRFYCFSKNAYFNIPSHKKIIVKPNLDDINLLAMACNITLSQSVIWIDGSNGRFTGLPESDYYHAIDKAIVKLKEQGKFKDEIYIKLRPKLSPNNNYLINALKSNGVKYAVLPDDLVLEALFIVSDQCIVIGNLTSALEYAHCFGHEAYSIYSLFPEQKETFFDRMEGFWKNIKLLS